MSARLAGALRRGRPQEVLDELAAEARSFMKTSGTKTRKPRKGIRSKAKGPSALRHGRR